MNFEIRERDGGLRQETIGLRDRIGYELSAAVDHVDLCKGCGDFLRYVGSYILDGAVISQGETIAYGCWLTKVDFDGEGGLMFLEYNPEATEFVFGVSNSVRYWLDQHDVCGKVGANFDPVRPDRLVVVSDGVYQGESIQGVRYPSPHHMSGWWLTTESYNGDINTLKKVHAYHVSAARPDLAKYFSLPFGYRFHSLNSAVWFDEKVANEAP
ncbi:hypothetical protein [Ralstonia pseudosolanacearum]|uniref:immunity protein Imm33 domain-containing protein n=1 Tax=Ralstonia pseudosolanacearum TaxID=1310165 RepID=UPI0018D17E3F|nr:hypothetical protein [Ralstonia pseudosolanacearum]